MRLSEEIKSTFKDAAKKLTVSKKRDFTAKVTEDYLGSSARRAESVLGWKRQSVEPDCLTQVSQKQAGRRKE